MTSIAAISRYPAKKLLTLELARLDEVQRAIYTNAIAGKLAAINTCLTIMDQRASLLGLYSTAPLSGTPTSKSSLSVLLPDGELQDLVSAAETSDKAPSGEAWCRLRCWSPIKGAIQ